MRYLRPTLPFRTAPQPWANLCIYGPTKQTLGQRVFRATVTPTSESCQPTDGRTRVHMQKRVCSCKVESRTGRRVPEEERGKPPPPLPEAFVPTSADGRMSELYMLLLCASRWKPVGQSSVHPRTHPSIPPTHPLMSTLQPQSSNRTASPPAIGTVTCRRQACRGGSGGGSGSVYLAREMSPHIESRPGQASQCNVVRPSPAQPIPVSPLQSAKSSAVRSSWSTPVSPL